MRLFKTLIVATLSTFAAASVEAATLAPAPGKSGEGLVVMVKHKTTKTKTKAGKCGVAKYWSKKSKKCEDARSKK
jgi:uncharacterized low-complexity protein